MQETTTDAVFDAAKLIGPAKKLFDATPTLLAELDKHHGEFPALDQKVVAVKAELMRINNGGEPGPDAENLLPLLKKLAESQLITTSREAPRDQTRAHMGTADQAPVAPPLANSIYSEKRYGNGTG